MMTANTTTTASPSAPAPAAAAPKPELRHAFGRFPTGIAVITTLDEDGQPYGITVNSFASVSMSPPMLSWNVIRGSRAHATIGQAQRFVVNILSQDQRHVAQQMASRMEDRFHGVAVRHSSEGLPVIEDALATFECEVHAMVEAGDHDIVLGRIQYFEHREGAPLVYWQGRYATAACEDH